ncbi:Nmad3 family putative nucleotide modification protein [Marinobacter oulmenensis]|uniref:Nucleotide modification associated domain-containing protein n=1 Tax=Marinobacter oulmenensis TaxID=643747 RepID=A0A840U4A7_9GAMM|nr:hypothetical protein [Marinobacter oulmenensis]MBB5319959.1 hypothetical protein [Marinobacter oulmenensis]
MKLILSRKGFDSASGGCPNPVFPDGRCLALPIPDPQSPIRYSQIRHQGASLGRLVAQLTGQPAFSRRGAHLDPDLLADALPRQAGWRPLLGQHSSAQAHLANHGVAEGDLFLFFALFQPVEPFRGRWRFVPGSQAFHSLWGWLQVAEVWPLDGTRSVPAWAAYHPHLHGDRSRHNCLYVGRDRLALPGRQTNLPGAGILSTLTGAHRLTEPGATRVTDWRLPAAFLPGTGRVPLSYHHKPERWSETHDGWCRLRSAARGQEFVLDLDDYPAVIDWLASPGLLG